MKYKMKKYSLFLISFLLVTLASAKSDGTYQSIKKEYTLLPDGGIVLKVSTVLTYNTQFAFNSLFGETFMVYNPNFQQLTIDTCYTIQKDGTVIQAPDNAFNEVLPAAAVKAPDYNYLKEMVVTHTGLEMGATAYLTYTLTTKPGFSPSLDIYDRIGMNGAEIKKYVVQVNLPKDVTLRWHVVDSKVMPQIKDNSYSWTFTNIPAVMGEVNTPDGEGGVIRLSATTSENLEQNLRPITIETMEMLRAPENLFAKAETEKQKVEALQRFIISSLALSRVTPDLAGYRVRQCGKILQTAYGTEAEKALGMARLMRAEGMDAKAVAVFRASDKVFSMKNVVEYMVWYNGKLYSVNSLNRPLPVVRGSRYVVCDLSGTVIETNEVNAKIETDLTLRVVGDTAFISGLACCNAAIVPAFYYAQPFVGDALVDNVIVKAKNDEVVGDKYTVRIDEGYAKLTTVNIEEEGDKKMIICRLSLSRYGAASWGVNGLSSWRTAP